MMYGCRVTALYNLVNSCKIFVALCHWIPKSTNHLTIVLAEKVRKSQKSLPVMIMIIVAVNLKLIMNKKV